MTLSEAFLVGGKNFEGKLGEEGNSGERKGGGQDHFDRGSGVVFVEGGLIWEKKGACFRELGDSAP